MAKTTNFHDRFVSLIDRTGLTDAILADRLGVSKQAFSAWRNGRRSPTRSMIEHIADTFHVDVAWLMGYDDDDDNSSTLSPDELRLLTAYRNADERARKDALSILESYPREEKKENRA